MRFLSDLLKQKKWGLEKDIAIIEAEIQNVTIIIEFNLFLDGFLKSFEQK